MAERTRPPWLTKANLEALKDRMGVSWARLGILIGSDYNGIYRMREGAVWVPNRHALLRLEALMGEYGVDGVADPFERVEIMRAEDI